MTDYKLLFDKAHELPLGEERINALLKIYETAKEEEQYYTMYFTDKLLTRYLFNLDKGKEAVSYFFRMWGIHTANIEKADQEEKLEVLWLYKWVLELLPECPDYGRWVIVDNLERYRNYCIEAGYSLRSYYKLYYAYLSKNGFFEEAEEFYQLWLKTERDELSDCEACDRDEEVHYLVKTNQIQLAFEKAQDLFDKKITCDEVPDKTYSYFLLPLYKEGRMEESKRLQQKGHFLLYKNVDSVKLAADHILFLALTDQNMALSVYERYIKEADKLASFYDSFYFYLASLVLKNVCDTKNKVNLLDREYLEYRVRYLANYFDIRNQNDFFNKQIQETLTLL